MSTFIGEILFVWVAFIIGVFQDNFKDVIKGILSGDWKGVEIGMSASGSFIALGILLMLSVIIFLMRRKENRKQEEARIIQSAIASKLGIDLDAEIAKAKQSKNSTRE